MKKGGETKFLPYASNTVDQENDHANSVQIENCVLSNQSNCPIANDLLEQKQIVSKKLTFDSCVLNKDWLKSTEVDQIESKCCDFDVAKIDNGDCKNLFGQTQSESSENSKNASQKLFENCFPFCCLSENCSSDAENQSVDADLKIDNGCCKNLFCQTQSESGETNKNTSQNLFENCFPFCC